jgi:hypothetical protein
MTDKERGLLWFGVFFGVTIAAIVRAFLNWLSR